MSWHDTLNPASWRGLAFGVFALAADHGRGTALHLYPKRETVWVEDLGGSKNPLFIQGFLVGDDVADRLQAMVDASRQPGPGELVHPLYGSQQLTLVEFRSALDFQRGRVIELSMTFIESGVREYPAKATSTSAEILDAAEDAEGAAKDGFLAQATSLYSRGREAISSAAATVQGYVSQVQGYARDASVMLHSVGGLVNSVGGVVGISTSTGALGRFFRGARTGLGFVAGGTGTVTSLIGRAYTARAATERAATSVAGLVSRL